MHFWILSRLRMSNLVIACLAVMYLMAIVLAECLVAFVHPIVGFSVYVVILMSLLVHAAYTRSSRDGSLLVSMTLVPLTRLISLAMPSAGLPEEWQFVLRSLPLLIAAIAATCATGLTRQDILLQFPAWRMLFPAVATGSTGLLLGAVVYEYSMLRPSDVAPSFDEDLVAAALSLALLTALTEEIVFRGVLQTAATRAMGAGAGIAFASTLYGVLHLSHRPEASSELIVLDVLFAFGVGLYFGLVAQLTRTLLGVVLAHGLATATAFVILPMFWD